LITAAQGRNTASISQMQGGDPIAGSLDMFLDALVGNDGHYRFSYSLARE
jgi:hypothetical protein